MMVSAKQQAGTKRAAKFNFSAPAELYGASTRGGWAPGVKYRRFDTAAEAIRHVVEELSGAGRRTCVLEVNEKRFNHIEICNLYDSSTYPLPRRDRKDTDAPKTEL